MRNSPFRQGGHGDAETDCHGQFENWPRNDRGFYMGCGTRPGGRPQGSPLRKRYKRCNGRATARVAPTKGLQGVRWFLWCVGAELCPACGRPQGSPLRRVTSGAAQIKGGPAGRPYGFYIHFLYTLCGVLRRINLPGAGVCLCRPTRCGPRPGAFPGRWLFPPGRSRCGVRPGSPGPGL